MSKPIVNHRRRYKVLNAPKIHPHVLAKFRRLTGLGEEIEPVFHRDGQYFDRLTKSAWAEIDGRAFSIDGNKFLEQVRLLSHRPLGMKVRRALITLREAGIKSNDLNGIIRDEFQWAEANAKWVEGCMMRKRIGLAAWRTPNSWLCPR